MKIDVVGLERDELVNYIKKNHPALEITKKNPKIIISYGGDGTLLYAERNYPGKLKVMIRKSQVCSKCLNETKHNILSALEHQKFKEHKHFLLEARVGNKRIYGLNDILVAHEKMNTALRFKIYLNDVQYGQEVLGDGVLISTPFGSTGYYQSITRSNFQEGLGIAFNNSVNVLGHLVVKEKNIITVKITRGPACIFPDNAKKSVVAETGKKITIQKSKRYSKLAIFSGSSAKFNISTSQNRVPLGYCQVCAKEYTDYA